ncbi:MAG: DUF177 domain-containing protein [marine benthic group bacterium]|jgi:uncharacterized protein|nr:DUF177 domain-containing protein [Candidatus Benthicola marisminoris]
MNSGFPAARIDLDRLRGGPAEGTADLPADAAAWGLEEIEIAEPPRLRYRAEPGGNGGIRVTGQLQARLTVSCRRCLEPVLCDLEIEFDYRFDPAVRVEDGEESVFPLDPDGAELDLSRALREELLLATPEYPVCEDSCRGLCPRCGAELNQDADCGCGGEEPDPRWNVLREMVSDGRAEGHLGEYDGNDG